MCLGIPGRIVAICDAERKRAIVGVAGVKREIHIVCIIGERTIDGFLGLGPGHVSSCQCGEVLKGVIKPWVIKPWHCKVFGLPSPPQAPLGALMVSSEGACAAYYQYGDWEGRRDRRAADAA